MEQQVEQSNEEVTNETMPPEPETPARPRKMLHVQVAGNATQEELETVLKQFHQTWLDNGVIASRENVSASIIELNEEISGTILVPAMTAEHIAYVAHNINRAYCEAIGEPVPPHWEEADQDMRNSLLRGVLFTLRHNSTPEMQHEEWMKTKLEQGWKLGPVKDAEKKEHPNLVPYDQLPQEQRVKDFLFRGVVNSLRWKLAVPNANDTIDVQKIVKGADGEPETTETVKIISLVIGDEFIHQDKRFVVRTLPYINYALPIPVWQLDVDPIAQQNESTESSNDQSTGTATEEAQPSA